MRERRTGRSVPDVGVIDGSSVSITCCVEGGQQGGVNNV